MDQSNIINAQIWEAVLAEIELEVSRAEFSAFFSGTALDSLTDNAVIILCRNSTESQWLEKKYSRRIASLFEEKTGKRITPVFKIKNLPARNQEKEVGPLFSPSTNFVGLDPFCTFENFAVSSSNQLAYAAAQAVIKKPGKAYNPLFLWGGVGVGKTHLMQAIGHEIFKKDKNTKIVFCMGEEFTNEIIEAIQNRTTNKFKRKYRSAQVLLLDDIQFIAGKIKVQEEFFHTFVSIKREGGQIILTSDRPPHEILELEARLRSRFEAGLIVDISQPNFELRTAIVLIKAKQHGIKISMDVARLLAESINDTRRLEGALMRLITQSQLNKNQITPEFTTEILRLVTTNGISHKKVSVSEIIKKVSSHFSITINELKSAKRSRNVVIPRQIVMYLLRKELKMSLQDVGAFLGGRDHTTVLHGVDKVEKTLLKNPGWSGEIMGIKKELWG